MRFHISCLISDFTIGSGMRFIETISLEWLKKFPKFFGKFLSLSVGDDAFGKFLILRRHFFWYFFTTTLAKFIHFLPIVAGKLQCAEKKVVLVDNKPI